MHSGGLPQVTHAADSARAWATAQRQRVAQAHARGEAAASAQWERLAAAQLVLLSHQPQANVTGLFERQFRGNEK